MVTASQAPPNRARVARPGAVLAAALLVAAASIAVVAFALGWVLGALLTLAAVVVALAATAAAMRRGSRVLAPLSVVVLAVANPVVVQATVDHVRDSVGVVTVEAGHGLVLWGGYPGISGWDAPADPQPVAVRDLVLDVQDAVRAIVDDTGDTVGWTWSVGDTSGGATTIANGFGGPSMFVRIDSPTWTTRDFTGSQPQRDILLAAVQGTADELALAGAADLTGDVETGDGVREYTDEAGGRLSLRIEDGAVTVVYAGGPFLNGGSEEYAARLAAFDGLHPPEPIVTPDLP